MTGQYQPRLGKLASESDRMDAVHVAVVPLVAAIEMPPGCHFGLDESGHAEISEFRLCVGVVDPFLKEPVKKGQIFWGFIYPGTVTSLRHQWTHPAFDTEESPLNPDVYFAEMRLREVADKCASGDYDGMLKGALSGGYCFSDQDYRYAIDWNQFWSDVQAVSGKEINMWHKDPSNFRCGC